jgi:hypothetical protein
VEALDVDRMRREIADLKEQVRQLRRRAREPEDVVRAIRDGEVDAFVVAHADGERIYRLRTADELYRRSSPR